MQILLKYHQKLPKITKNQRKSRIKCLKSRILDVCGPVLAVAPWNTAASGEGGAAGALGGTAPPNTWRLGRSGATPSPVSLHSRPPTPSAGASAPAPPPRAAPGPTQPPPGFSVRRFSPCALGPPPPPSPPLCVSFFGGGTGAGGGGGVLGGNPEMGRGSMGGLLPPPPLQMPELPKCLGIPGNCLKCLGI